MKKENSPYLGTLPESGLRYEPAVSVIVPTYNRMELLRWTLSSLANQLPGTPRFEVLVCDDGSSDGTREAVEKFKDSLRVSYYYQEDKGYRVAKARNLGIRAAKGRICVFLDSGVIVKNDFVRAHLEIHDSFPDPSAVIGYVHGFDEADAEGHRLLDFLDPFDPETTIERIAALGGFSDMREPAYRQCGKDLGRLPAPWSFFWTCNVSAPRAEIERAGLFDEAFQSWGVEDVDLGYRLYRLGLKFRIGWKAEAIHCPHPRDIEGNARSDMANRKLFFRKHLDFPSEALQFSTDFDFNPMLSGFFEARRRRPVSRIDLGSLLAALGPALGAGKVVLAGTAGYGSLDSREGLDCLEPDPALAEEWIAKYPGARVLKILGLATPFPDGAFDAAIISEDWLHLGERWMHALLQEQTRIAKRQILLLGGSLSPEQAMAQLGYGSATEGKRIVVGEAGGSRYLAIGPAD